VNHGARLSGQIRCWLRPRRRRTARCAPSSCVLASDESDSEIRTPDSQDTP
jgi:hypothetical protein